MQYVRDQPESEMAACAITADDDLLPVSNAHALANSVGPGEGGYIFRVNSTGQQMGQHGTRLHKLVGVPLVRRILILQHRHGQLLPPDDTTHVLAVHQVLLRQRHDICTAVEIQEDFLPGPVLAQPHQTGWGVAGDLGDVCDDGGGSDEFTIRRVTRWHQVLNLRDR